MKLVFDVLNKFKHKKFTHLMHGTADGVDKLANEWGIENKMVILPRPANWNLHKLAAGPIRNIEMAKEAHELCGDSCELVAIWNGKSSGTKQMYDNWKEKYPNSPAHLYRIRPKVSQIDWGKRSW